MAAEGLFGSHKHRAERRRRRVDIDSDNRLKEEGRHLKEGPADVRDEAGRLKAFLRRRAAGSVPPLFNGAIDAPSGSLCVRLLLLVKATSGTRTGRRLSQGCLDGRGARRDASP
uniref:IBB domain-containing protein n=1 Tax=Plectus sambesii TaxID=2011161 RepID=A0A914VM77_9BILA